MTSSPRASASMKSGSVLRRAIRRDSSPSHRSCLDSRILRSQGDGRTPSRDADIRPLQRRGHAPRSSSMTTNGNGSVPRPVVLRHGTVLTMDAGHRVLQDSDVLVVDRQIAAVGQGLTAPDGALEIDATGGIVMPGMIDTHRHMWQTALRGYGADWTLTQYFVWFYLEWGKVFRAEDIHAGNVLSALEAVDAGVTTTVDWSHGLQTVDHADAAVDALQSVPGRFVLAYGNLQQAPWEWATSSDFRSFVNRRFGTANDLLGLQLAFDVTGDPAFPEKAAFEVA